jgi:ribosomal protein S18 acetylase RimI-like enzyme
MRHAHEGGSDAEMNELYRTSAGCRALLDNVFRQRGCGAPVLPASAMARLDESDRAVGFTLVTETAKGRAHLAQLAVAPDLQRSGVGRALLAHSAVRLAAFGFETASLMVSEENRRAAELYHSLGFETRVRFPVFSRDR